MFKIKAVAAIINMPISQILNPIMKLVDKAKLLESLTAIRILITIINCSRTINRS